MQGLCRLDTEPTAPLFRDQATATPQSKANAPGRAIAKTKSMGFKGGRFRFWQLVETSLSQYFKGVGWD